MFFKPFIAITLESLGWILAGTSAGAMAAIALFVAITILFDSEAIGQGMILLGACAIFIPIGGCVGFTRAVVAWERQSTKDMSYFDESP